MGRVQHTSSASQNASKYKEAEDVGTKKKQTRVDDLDSFFSSGSRSSSVPKSRATTETFSKPAFNATKKTSSGVPSGVKKPVPPANLVDDFSSLFGADPLFGEFEDIPGESEERRKARWDRERRTKNRVVCLCFGFSLILLDQPYVCYLSNIHMICLLSCYIYEY
ncbi:PREDICTED: auxilin-related protein 2-like [Tarenaya hassleriana]|uniref:auxilin-related protein 2-like n=1 Tax=Tarenaya hassleriana TaxID=28532 RepID=UPI00053C21D6|nr:PREDICTED: auxilin-related protein 2-like [Tarenaya hassleriana]